MEEVQECFNKIRHWFYRITSRCLRCDLQTKSLIRTVDGPYLCLPCVVKFNQRNLVAEVDVFICTTCGGYYQQSAATDTFKLPTNLLYCQNCLSIQTMLQNYDT